ncbi:uncharacterized protein LOC117668538 [Pantherophis guttatus]|uniref:Uncharacterized protein LOC117668538 n=1 Tax=Pantherophis guttatus TaxID=94885 RepID=A0A6P9C760_PANGU|nr:uncharacterized protein LOC117668538 [Pantherophis guttatus]
MPKASHKSKHCHKASSSDSHRHHGVSPASNEVPSGSSSRPDPSGPSQPLNKAPSRFLPSRAEARRDKVLKKICAKASGAQSVAKETPSVSTRPPSGSDSAAQGDRLSLQDCPAVIETTDLWGSSAPTASVPPPESSPAQTAEEAVPAGIQHHSFPSTEQIQQMIAAAVQQSLASHFQSTSRAASVRSVVSPPREGRDQEDVLSIDAPDSPVSSMASRSPSHAAEEPHDLELSEDDDLPPEQPAFTGLFPQALFKSLLHKAIATAQLSSPSPLPVSDSAPKGTLNPLFAEPARTVDTISTPPLFLDVIKKQWSSPGSAPTPTAADRRNFSIAPDLDSLLQVPSVDAPVAALLPHSVVPGDPEEGLRPEERRAEHVLQRAHQGASWAIRAAATVSFFNRTTLLWLQRLQESLTTEDSRIQQDLNKIIAATQFSADATLNAARFAAKSLASSVTAHRLVWLRHWQADARHKWRLASVPFAGPKLFGDSLDPFLSETKDKKKFLPVVFCRGDSRFRPYTPRPQSRPYDRSPFSPSLPRSQGNFQPRQRGGQDRSSRESGGDNGRQSPGLGCTLSGSPGSGRLDLCRVPSLHQLVGTPSDLPSTSDFSSSRVQLPRPGPHGQYHSEGPCQPSGGHPFSFSNVGGVAVGTLVGDPSGVVTGGTHLRCHQSASRLAQPSASRSCGVASQPSSLPPNHDAFRDAGARPLCHVGQCSATAVYLTVPVGSGRGSRCSSLPVAPGAPICLSSGFSSPSCDSQVVDGTGGDHSGGSTLATQTLVCGPSVVVDNSTLAVTSASGRFNPRDLEASRSTVAPSDRLAIERHVLGEVSIPADVISIIQASRRPSTDRIYSATWKSFCAWCDRAGVPPLQASIVNILVFLREGLRKGLSPNTLRRQVAAISSVLTFGSLSSLSQHPLIRRFLRGATNLCPPVLHRYPTWDLSIVLNSLTSAPYEPLRTTSLRLLTCKVAFLVAITSARRISELAALSIREDLCVFHADRVVLRLDPTFVPKVNTTFHRMQELILPNFCPHPTHRLERRWHSLDVRRALRIYIKRTARLRKTESLFVSFLPVSLGSKVSSSTVGRWIRQTIAKAYELQSLPRPPRLTAHSTRSAATSAAWATQASLLEICRAATWTSPSPFIQHYKLDKFASADAAFGRRVLQRVVSGEGTSDQTGPTRL